MTNPKNGNTKILLAVLAIVLIAGFAVVFGNSSLFKGYIGEDSCETFETDALELIEDYNNGLLSTQENLEEMEETLSYGRHAGCDVRGSSGYYVYIELEDTVASLQKLLEQDEVHSCYELELLAEQYLSYHLDENGTSIYDYDTSYREVTTLIEEFENYDCVYDELHNLRNLQTIIADPSCGDYDKLYSSTLHYGCNTPLYTEESCIEAGIEYHENEGSMNLSMKCSFHGTDYVDLYFDEICEKTACVKSIQCTKINSIIGACVEDSVSCAFDYTINSIINNLGNTIGLALHGENGQIEMTPGQGMTHRLKLFAFLDLPKSEDIQD